MQEFFRKLALDWHFAILAFYIVVVFGTVSMIFIVSSMKLLTILDLDATFLFRHHLTCTLCPELSQTKRGITYV